MSEIIGNLVRFSLNKDKYESVNIYCQDENRFGLITKQSKVLPDNIILLPIPSYCLELNLAEKMWQYLKSKIAMKVYDTIEDLNDNRTNKYDHEK